MSKGKVALMEFEGNPNIGIYMFVNDKFALIGKELRKDKLKEVEGTLGVPVYKVTVLETELVGIFVAGNNHVLLLPEMHEHEMKRFEEIAKKHEMKIITVSDKLNTLGNNVCLSDSEILINPDYPKSLLTKLAKQTGYRVIPIKNRLFKAVGSVFLFANNKYFVSQELEEEDVKDIVDKIGGVGTVNSGGNFIASGVIGNVNGVILGSHCTTIEIQNVVDSLEYL